MPETQNSPVSVEPERQAETPSEKPAPGNPLRRIALGVAVLTAVLFTLSIFMERRTPSTSQAVVQAYVVEMAAEVGGRVTEIAVLDNARVKAGQVLFRIDPQPYKLVVSEAEARLEETGQALGASTASVDAAQAQLVSARAQRDNIREQARRVNQMVERGVFAPARQDEAKASLGSAEAAVSKACRPGAGAPATRAQRQRQPAIQASLGRAGKSPAGSGAYRSHCTRRWRDHPPPARRWPSRQRWPTGTDLYRQDHGMGVCRLQGKQSGTCAGRRSGGTGVRCIAGAGIQGSC